MSLPISRSESLTNLPIIEHDPRTGLPEDIQKTWSRKSKKVASLTGKIVIEFENIRKQKKNKQPRGTSIQAEPVCMESKPFLLCGNTWTLLLYPYGVDEDSECLSIKLQNHSDDIINAYYALSIKRSNRDDDDYRINFWVDPDIDNLYFQPNGTQDDSWGVDDFIPLNDLWKESNGYMDIYPDDPEPEPEPEPERELEQEQEQDQNQDHDQDKRNGDENVFTATKDKDNEEDKKTAKKTKSKLDDSSVAISVQPSVEVPVEFYMMKNSKGERVYDRIFIEVQMMVYGEVSLKAHPFTQAIEGKNATDEELIKIADADLDLIREATKGGGVSLEWIEQQQDNILLTLCPPIVVEDKKKGSTFKSSIGAGDGAGISSTPTPTPTSPVPVTAESKESYTVKETLDSQQFQAKEESKGGDINE
jgi:hypothetical protein